MERLLKSKYRIGDKINEDEQSVTYKGSMLGDGQPLTIKIFKRDGLTSPLIKKLLRDFQPLTTLTHPNIPRYLDGDYGWQGLYFVREYVDGESLWELMKYDRKLTEPQWLSVMMGVCEAVKVAHDQGILHGTLNPGDIFVTKEGQIKVTDFRLAMALRGADLGRTVAVMRHATFLAPEEILGEPSTRSSDIYRIGLVFYLLLTGKLPSQKEGLLLALSQLQEAPPQPISLNSAVPRYLQDITLKCLAKDPLKRFANVKKIIESLRAKAIVTPPEPDVNFPELDVLQSPPDIITQAANPEPKPALVPRPASVPLTQRLSKVSARQLIGWGLAAAAAGGAIVVLFQFFGSS